MLQKKSTSANYTNIPQTGFSSNDEQTSVQQVWVKNKISGFFQLSLFSIFQLIAGAKLYTANKDKVEGSIVSLLATLFGYALENQPAGGSQSHEESPMSVIQLTRDEVKTLKLFLETRMANCERERDERIMRTHGSTRVQLEENTQPAFNADSYIAQKMLLIELREWLLGEECEAPNPSDESSAYVTAIKSIPTHPRYSEDEV